MCEQTYKLKYTCTQDDDYILNLHFSLLVLYVVLLSLLPLPQVTTHTQARREILIVGDFPRSGNIIRAV